MTFSQILVDRFVRTWLTLPIGLNVSMTPPLIHPAAYCDPVILADISDPQFATDGCVPSR